MPEAKHMNHEEFFEQLAVLLKSCQANGHGTVLLSQKRLTYDQRPPNILPKEGEIAGNSLWDLNCLNPLPLIIRASNAASPEKRKAGQKTKISTIVKPDQLEAFYFRYADICKKNMEGLRKRDRSKKKKEKKKIKKEGETG
ncbi:uncharacterized protein PV09_05613 [Verruconis gallopava]|uniref:Signal recognition particle subunit SRP14 n=1 Tax=Verruconis gallopava TaxID=253628 RepID=A0A0D2A867_9PEZI|nr:uncharacterized protein PV09_05613 [Verruconis gallopava]KIW02948.1 hypothetical protein PV09_05613 [Verruconis gallopava]